MPQIFTRGLAAAGSSPSNIALVLVLDSLSRGGKSERGLAEIWRGHFVHELHDSILPFVADLLEIRIVLAEMRAQLRRQRILLVTKDVDRRPDRHVARHRG